MDTTTAKLHEALTQVPLDGDVYTDEKHRILYATDASAYREIPVAVTRPRSADDIKKIIAFADKHGTSVIPRAAGTSLAGQVVGPGIVMDISHHQDKIIEINYEERWARVEPGVNRDHLNNILRERGLFFAPETSTSNRCKLGGMLGNNSCGAHSLVYGSTREHTLEVKAILSDGSEAHFKPLPPGEFDEKCGQSGLEGTIYQNIRAILSDENNQQNIRAEYPDPSNPRKNTGYALDILLESNLFTPGGEDFNFCKLLAGSEGTLAFTTEMKIKLEPLPPSQTALVCAHFDTIDEALRANLVALAHKPLAVELMDDTVLNATKTNHTQAQNRFFVKGNPRAILIAEFSRETEEALDQCTHAMIAELQATGMGFHYPVVKGKDIDKVWDLRKAGLGALANVPGDKKSTTVIEDTSVKVERLPEYIKEFQETLDKYQVDCVYYAHVGSGELHLRPMLDLKKKEEVQLFHDIGRDVAKLVKKYRGSLSGEHGDGRLRGQFIPLMMGDEVYALLKSVKKAWDPNNIFNPGKITDTPPMTDNLRFQAGGVPEVQTWFRYPEAGGFVQAVERCNGSGDCLKARDMGGGMCPSFMVTRDEEDSTRGRANMLRELFSNPRKGNIFDHKEIYEALDLCLSCKACKSECPANVDMAKLKAEFLQHYYDNNGIPLRARAVAYLPSINKAGAKVPGITNFFLQNKTTAGVLKHMLGFAQARSVPALSPQPLARWQKKKQRHHRAADAPNGRVYLFNDEFTNYNDTSIGIKAILLLTRLGYEVLIPKHTESGRTYFSKGLLRQAQKKAERNVKALQRIVSEDTPLVGIEPSAILGFRDEYPDIVGKTHAEGAKRLARSSFLFEEFFAREIDAGRIKPELFTAEKRHIKLHGHCQQKAVASTRPSLISLAFPKNYTVEEIPSGCCGMAGAFGYEKEHYAISMKIGEMVLFPAVRGADSETLIAAPGTSCRHQIKDGARRTALHPVEILYDALRK